MSLGPTTELSLLCTSDPKEVQLNGNERGFCCYFNYVCSMYRIDRQTSLATAHCTPCMQCVVRHKRYRGMGSIEHRSTQISLTRPGQSQQTRTTAGASLGIGHFPLSGMVAGLLHEAHCMPFANWHSACSLASILHSYLSSNVLEYRVLFQRLPDTSASQRLLDRKNRTH